MNGVPTKPTGLAGHHVDTRDDRPVGARLFENEHVTDRADDGHLARRARDPERPALLAGQGIESEERRRPRIRVEGCLARLDGRVGCVDCVGCVDDDGGDHEVASDHLDPVVTVVADVDRPEDVGVARETACRRAAEDRRVRGVGHASGRIADARLVTRAQRIEHDADADDHERDDDNGHAGDEPPATSTRVRRRYLGEGTVGVDGFVDSTRLVTRRSDDRFRAVVSGLPDLVGVVHHDRPYEPAPSRSTRGPTTMPGARHRRSHHTADPTTPPRRYGAGTPGALAGAWLNRPRNIG
jgi:hypothetical protein